jgi:uncharacterized protein YjbI with pentapeptide repeats
MAKKASAGSSKVPRKLEGKSVYLAGKHWGSDHRVLKLVKAEGGMLVDELTDKTDIMVLGYAAVANPQKKATKLNAQGAAIQVLSLADFDKSVLPTSDEAETLLKGGEIDRWNLLCSREFRWNPSGSPTIVRHVDFRGAKLAGACLVGFDGCDFRDADLSRCQLELTKCDLTDARLDKTQVESLVECEGSNLDFRKCAVEGSEFIKSNLTGAVFAGGRRELQFTECNLDGADFSKFVGVNLDCVFKGCSLKNADFSGSRFERADFTKSDLTGANFRSANLSMAKLSGAVVEGADFTDAVLIAAEIDGVDFSKAKGYDPAQTQPKGTAGPAVAEFLKAAGQADQISTSVSVVDGSDSHQLAMTVGRQWAYCSDNAGLWLHSNPSKSPTAIWTTLAAKWQNATPEFGTLAVRASKSQTPSKELKKLALAAWSELFGVEAPSEDELKQAAQANKAKKSETADEWAKVLKSGPKGVERWNADSQNLSKSLAKVADIDLAGAKLEGLKLHGVAWKNAKLVGANLSDSDLSGCDFRGGDFSNASFRQASVTFGGLSETKLAGANFFHANLSGAALKRADCTNADFAGARMQGADLSGADLTGANLAAAVLDRVSYDEHTRWPKKFKPTLEMIWKGPGTSPAAHALVQSTNPKGKLDIDQFMKRLEELTDAGKLDKALKMLKADRFRLYAQVEDDHFVGVVKSQGDPDLVYSCRLNSDGTYACCTQNLNICGGLRGSLCKHLLVLIVGLSKGGDLDPNAIDTWIRLSKTNKPALDKDQMSETFLRYKGAEAGEVDWRPTETIPEDYYAM